MAVLPLVKAPDPRLKLISEPVSVVDSALRRFMADMLETMKDASGIGLAAIQVGVPKRVAVIDLDPGGSDSKPIYLVNPRVVDVSAELTTYHEGCLSVPEIWDDVQRPTRITVEFTDEKGRPQTIEAEGLLATCLQHEIDHVNGLLFIDHLSKLKRDRVEKKFAKAAKREAVE